MLDNKEILVSCFIGGITSIIGIVKIIYFNISMSAPIDNTSVFATALKSSVSVGIGLYLIVIAGIGVSLLSYKMKKTSTNN